MPETAYPPRAADAAPFSNRLPWQRSLIFKVTAPTIALIGLATAGGTYFKAQQLRRNHIAEVAQRSTQSAEIVLASLQRSMLHADQQSFTHYLDDLRHAGVVAGVHLTDIAGVVRFSTDRDLLGRALPEDHHLPFGIVVRNGRERYDRELEIPAGETCRACHLAAGPVLGTIHVETSLALL